MLATIGTAGGFEFIGQMLGQHATLAAKGNPSSDANKQLGMVMPSPVQVQWFMFAGHDCYLISITTCLRSACDSPWGTRTPLLY
jgi:hypothetical protein